MVADCDPTSDPVAHELLNLIFKLSIIDMIALRAKYHVSCLAARVKRARQPNTGKVIGKKKKNIAANLLIQLNCIPTYKILERDRRALQFSTSRA